MSQSHSERSKIPHARKMRAVAAGLFLGCAGAALSGCSESGTVEALAANLNNAAFPGAEGYGKVATGGRGGRIIQVTTLADSGAGSLRACIDASGPRVCVFRVGGVIRFTNERPIIRNGNLTIAGQTAPGGGILLTHAGGNNGLTPLVVKNTSNVIVRHIRVRTDRRGTDRASNSAFIIENSSKVVLDHVSASWALDENVGGYATNTDVTISSSIFAEGIPRHDKCALLSSDPRGPQRLSFIRNLCAHNGDRNPDINFMPGSCVEVINNVLYNASVEFAEVWESYGGTPVSIVGNYFKAGPNTKAVAAAITRQTVESKGNAQVYVLDNQLDGLLSAQTPNVAPILVRNPTCPLASPVMPASAAYTQVLQSSGAFPRDSVDERIVGEVRTRTGAQRTDPGILPVLAAGRPYADADKDGMSDSWEVANGLNPAQNDAWGDKDGNGWSNLDDFLNYAHAQVLAGRAVN
ncbi:pectate lyase [Sphingomonas sp. C3-2]|uniref:pectate lyase family protein n=1 Tax=Sphingomonas sp. C3-2 TaxID=3062169 RepID=UPI00294AA521|nr:pectate lyase [Sphingomonas sp. C3-2]WOK36505.1 pectate lyase [Sphingomonas sp. C3-2]